MLLANTNYFIFKGNRFAMMIKIIVINISVPILYGAVIFVIKLSLEIISFFKSQYSNIKYKIKIIKIKKTYISVFFTNFISASMCDERKYPREIQIIVFKNAEVVL